MLAQFYRSEDTKGLGAQLKVPHYRYETLDVAKSSRSAPDSRSFLFQRAFFFFDRHTCSYLGESRCRWEPRARYCLRVELTQWRKRPQRAGRFVHFRSPFKTDAQRVRGADEFVHACLLPMLVVCCWLATALAGCLPGTRRCNVHRKINEKERRSTHSFHLKRTGHSEKCTGPTCKIIFYPLLVQLERWDNSLRRARHLSHSGVQWSILCHWRKSERRNSNTKAAENIWTSAKARIETAKANKNASDKRNEHWSPSKVAASEQRTDSWRSGSAVALIELRSASTWTAARSLDTTKSNKIKRNQDLTLPSPRVCPCLKLMLLSGNQLFDVAQHYPERRVLFLSHFFVPRPYWSSSSGWGVGWGYWMYIKFMSKCWGNHALAGPLETVPGEDSLLTTLHRSFFGENHHLIASLHTNLHQHSALVWSRPARLCQQWTLPQTLIPESVIPSPGWGSQFTSTNEEGWKKTFFWARQRKCIFIEGVGSAQSEKGP